MSLEYCNECGAETGRAGRHDDSLYHSSEGPFCGDCFDSWAEKSIEKIDALRAENERLERERAEQWSLRRDREAERDTKSAVIAELRAELAALKAVPDGVEVVGVVCVSRFKNRPEMENVEFQQAADIPQGQHPLMTVAQHSARMAEKDAEIEHLNLLVSAGEEVARQLQQNADVERIRADAAMRRPVADDREAFETAAARHKVEGLGFSLRQIPSGAYISNETRLLYEGWKLGRAALSDPAAVQEHTVGYACADHIGNYGAIKVFAEAGEYECEAFDVPVYTAIIEQSAAGQDVGALVEALISCAKAKSAAEVGLIVYEAIAAHKAGGVA